MRGNIDTCILRYVVPFTFEADNSYDDVCRILSKNSNWSLENILKGEQDIYSYMTETLVQNDEGKSNIGCSWRFQQESDNILKLAFHPNNKGQILKFYISKAGMNLFRNGVGLFWYEIANLKKKNSNLSVDELISFQKLFKELNRSSNSKYLYKIGKCNLVEIDESMLIDQEHINDDAQSEYEKCIYIADKGEHTCKYISSEYLAFVKGSMKEAVNIDQNIEKVVLYSVFRQKKKCRKD